MNEKFTSTTTRKPGRDSPVGDVSLDPRDDAPRLTREWAEKAELRVGDTILREAQPRTRIGRPRKDEAEVKKPVSLRLSKRLLAAARASGPGWQTRATAAIEREFLGEHASGKSAAKLGAELSAKPKSKRSSAGNRVYFAGPKNKPKASKRA